MSGQTASTGSARSYEAGAEILSERDPVLRTLIAALGGEVTPERFLSLPPETLRAAGLSANKAASIGDLAAKVLDGSVVLDPAGLRERGDEGLVAMLSAGRGIGT